MNIKAILFGGAFVTWVVAGLSADARACGFLDYREVSVKPKPKAPPRVVPASELVATAERRLEEERVTDAAALVLQAFPRLRTESIDASSLEATEPEALVILDDLAQRDLIGSAHAYAALARLRPGNSGGFGFKGRRLNLSDYESTLAGYIDDSGRRTSVFAPGLDGLPRLVAVMLARQHEEAGEEPAIRGMPLGLPSIAPEDIQLVESWVAQGRPR